MNAWRNFGRAALAAAALLLATQTSFGQRGGECLTSPVLYSDDGYRGRSIPLFDSTPNLHAQGMGDDASSVCVPNGWRVVLYEDTNYGGDYLELFGPAQIGDLKRDRPEGTNWGDRVSSVKVFKPVRRGGRTIDCAFPTLFSNDGFEGRNLTARDSIPDTHRFGMGDDASSVCVPAGWRVVLYEDTNYRGSRLELRGPDSIADLKRDRPDGANWGDRISSIQVYRDGGAVTPPIRRGSIFDPTPAPAARCDRYPTLYEHGNYQGRSLELTASVADLRARSFSDIASSVCVPRGWRVALYSESNYRGQSITLEGPDTNPGLDRFWNDRVRSVQVQAPGRWRDDRRGDRRNPGDWTGDPGAPSECSQYPALFADSGFRGRSLPLDRSVDDLHRLGMGDAASSLCVPAGWVVVLYADDNYRGASVQIRGEAVFADLESGSPDGYGWGDRVSSVRVDRSWR